MPKQKSNWLQEVEDKRKEVQEAIYPRRRDLEEQWKCICKYQDGLDHRNEVRYSGRTSLEALESYMESDWFPPPELLLTICSQFRKYMNAEGELDLEEIFFGETSTAGKYAQRTKNSERGIYWDFYISSNLQIADLNQDLQSIQRAGMDPEPSEELPNPTFRLRKTLTIDERIDGFLESKVGQQYADRLSDDKRDSFKIMYNRWHKRRKGESKKQTKK